MGKPEAESFKTETKTTEDGPLAADFNAAAYRTDPREETAPQD